MGEQRVALTGAIDADDPAEAAVVPRLHAGEGVLEDRRARGRDAEDARRLEEGVGRRLAAQMALLGDDAVDADLEQVLDAGRHEHVVAVVARGHDRPPHARRARGPPGAPRPPLSLAAPAAGEA